MTIRFATAADAATIVRLIRALAGYEHLIEHVRISEADVLRDGFGARPRFECLLAEAEGATLGFALFYHTYSTFAGRPEVWVEDIFVGEGGHVQGISASQADGAARRDRARRDCAHLALSVLLEPRARLLPAARSWSTSRTGCRTGSIVGLQRLGADPS